ncbi:MAG: AAA family ATPase, partial [Deltaproteobacteria bacterium]|nr:AAA family ATPase [Deltaproteobacteria bacterium]
YDDVRRSALLCAATAGFETGRVRRRLHMLLVGPPGCGKTEILLWFNRHLDAHFVNAEFTTKVGLSADARGGEVTPGVLAEADGGIICIDELDRLAHNDQNALLQAMEEGSYMVIKAKHRKRLRANVVVIASANDKEKIQKPLLDRFDFIHELKTPTREERMKTVGTLVETFFSSATTQEKVLRHYLRFVQNHEPKVSDEVKERVSKLIMTYIRTAKTDITQLSYRSLELSILRIAYAIAKLQRSDLREEHVRQAIKLKDPEFAVGVDALIEAYENGLLA